MANLGKYSRDGKLSSEMSTGVLDEKGPVVNQIGSLLRSSKAAADVPVPPYLPVVEPWYRYQEYESVIRQNYKGQHLFNNIHPTTTREVAIFQHNETFISRGMYLANTIRRPTKAMLTWSKRFECSAFWCNMSMKLHNTDGKAAPGTCFDAIPETKNETETAILHPCTATATTTATIRAAVEENKEKKELLVVTVAKDERSKIDSGKVLSQSLRNGIVSTAMYRSPSGTYKNDRSPLGRKGKIIYPFNETVEVEVPHNSDNEHTQLLLPPRVTR